MHSIRESNPHRRQRSNPHNQAGNQNSNRIGEEGFFAIQPKKISGDGSGIDSSSRYRHSHKNHQTPKPIFLDIFSRSSLCPAPHKKCGFFVVIPLQEVSVGLIEKEIHKRENQQIGQKAKNQSQIDIHSI